MNTEEYKKIYLESLHALENIASYLQPKLPILSELQLTARQESIMIIFIRQEGMSLKDMAQRLGISKSAVTQSVNKLENEGLLIRSINEQNRREVTMSLGKTGRQLKKEFETFEASIIEDYITQLHLDDLKQVLETFRKFERIIKEGEQSTGQ
ncbi:MarR family winged helix-turn-helix transcriptional regulator [Salibacterium halotolerans]|uniref:DNA-binding transcriptional regulator, MarR family n=1 Tax=Salibacterium halotolerans TaxID=1884432 RepID=A0A1I5TVR0_9BACI|nr:MarR family transcriptional regulator [Salibacterium halotolerans]SFP87123.1 DNA-binding transcriptional regulator, MarR family [Salibacterium halotolerans]